VPRDLLFLIPHPCSPSPTTAIRVGLALIKGVGAALLSRIVTERERRGMFRSLPDFIRRTASAGGAATWRS